MSTTVDQRVVEMRFDNKRFESNVSTTMSTLEKLKQSLNLTGASKGLENVNAAAQKCDMSVLSNAAETAKQRFSALEIMAVTALANITNSAVNAGKRIVSALTIDPIKTGFNEYETKINAIQTIMSNTASKGTTMEDVTRVIGELNTYADKTIYNFAEMTRNIGTFTAAGVGLEESASAIQGIANLAAASGSTSQQASTAMYQLSQALASGTVKLMDWNSVVNAGMGGQKFQDALKATAKEHGIAIDDIIKKNGSFRDSLQDGWLSADILNETLQKFTVEGAKEYADSMVKSGKYTKEQADALIKEAQAMEDAATKVKTFTQLWDTLKESAQSGWSQTWEIIVGDFEEAKAFLTEVSDTLGGIIGASADARNEMLENWKVLGGRNDLIESLRNVFEGVSSIVTPIKEAFREIFPPMTSEQLKSITEGIKNLTSKLKIGDETADKIKRTFKGLFAVIDIVKQIVTAAFKAFGSLTGTFGDLGGGLLDITAKFGDWLVGVSEAIRSSNVLNKVFKGIATVIKTLVTVVKKVFSTIGDIFLSFCEGASEVGVTVSSVFEGLGSAIENCSLFKILQSLWNGIKKIVSGIGKAFGTLAEKLGASLGGNNLSGILDVISTLIAGGVGISLINFIKSLKDTFGGISDIVENFADIFGGLSGVLEGYQNKLNAQALMKIAIAIAILAGSVLVLSMINSEKLYDSVVALAMLFGTLVGSLAILSKSTGQFKGALKMSTVMLSISASVLILASALKKISDIEPGQMVSGILGVAALMGIVVGAVKILSAGSSKNVIKGATQMVIFAAAIKILASVCEDLSYLSGGDLAKGLLGIAALAGIIVATAKLLSMGNSKDIIKGATQMVVFAAAIKIMASVCADFAEMSWDGIRKGLLGIAGILAEILIFTKLMGNTKSLVSTGVSLIAIAAAMKIFASAAMDIASLTWEEIAKGLVAMAGALVAVTIALRLMPRNMISSGLGLIAVASAIMILASALDKMSGMSWGEIGKSMTALGGAMLILAVGLNVMKNTLAGSAALLVASAALTVLTPVLLTLGSMSWEAIAKGLLVLAGAFTILGVAGLVLGPIIPAILGLAAAMALLGVGTLAFGAGLTMTAAGIISLVGALAGSVVLLVDMVRAVITGILEGVADGIVAFCKIISSGAPAIAEAVKAVVLAVCDVLVECVPVIVDTILKILVALLDALGKYTPKIVDALVNFIIGVIESLGRNLPRLIKAVVDLIAALFSGVIDALKDIDPKVMMEGVFAVGLMAGLIAALSAITPMIPGALAGVLGMGVVIAELAIVLAAIGALAQIPGLSWLVEEGGNLLESIGTAIGQFVGGIVGGIAKGFTSSLPEIGSDLSGFMNNAKAFIEGAKAIDNATLSGVKSLVGIILALTAADIIEGLTSWFTGGSSLVKFGEDIAEFGPCIKQYADAVAGIDASAVESSANAAKTLAQMAECIPNQGGLVAWFTGDNSIANFSGELVTLGMGLKSFSDSVVGINSESIIAAAEAAKILAEMTSSIPNEGGMVAWFTDDNSVSKFAEELVALGTGLKGFSDAIIGINPEYIVAAAEAAKVLSDMTSSIPNQGGMVAWFTGENSVSKFGEDLVALGTGLKGFSDAIIGVKPERLTAAAGAAKSLAEMTTIIPNEGGMVAWFTGDNSVSKFGGDLVALGTGLKGFSNAIAGVNPDSLIAAANAAKSIAEMTEYIPNQNGMAQWFTGEKSISKFGGDLVSLGNGIKGFANAITGMNPTAVTSAANSAKAIAEMTHHIPNEGGMVAWFTGEKSLSNFADNLGPLGKGLKSFSDAVEGINAENVSAAAAAARGIAEMVSVAPTEGGIKAWFAGEVNLSSFADKLPDLGKGIKGFSSSVAGINAESVSAAAKAMSGIADMIDALPSEPGDLFTYGYNLTKFGIGVRECFKSIGGVGEGQISAAKNALESIKDIAEIDSGGIENVSSAIKGLTDSLKKLFSYMVKDFTKVGKESMNAFINGIEDSLPKIKRACKDMVEKCADAIEDKKSSFKTAGKNLVEGFADGIDANTYKAEAEARAMAKAAAKAAEKALKINSPSKVFRDIGSSVPEGFALGIEKFGRMVVTSSLTLGDNAIYGVKKAISNIANIINNDIDAQPTIRPVLDLSDVRSGASAIGSLFGDSAIGVSANVGAITAMMSKRNQNGSNDDVVSAISDLRKDLSKVGNTTYQIGDITYSEGTEVADAVRTITRAIKMDRRM